MLLLAVQVLNLYKPTGVTESPGDDDTSHFHVTLDHDLLHLVANVGHGCHSMAPYLLLGLDVLTQEPPWSMHDDMAVQEVIEHLDIT